MLPVVLGLFAASLLISQSAMDAMASLLTVTMVWFAYRWRQQRSVHTLVHSMGADWLFGLWILVVFVGFVVQGFPSDHWVLVMLDFKWLIVFYVVVAALMYIRPKEKIWPWMAGVFAVCSLYAIAVWFLGFDPVRPGTALETLPDGTLRTGGFLSQPIVFAHLYQLPLCVLLGLWLSMWQWREKGHWWVLAASSLGAVAILLSFSRGVWISLGVAALVMTAMFSLRMAVIVAAGGASLFAALYSLWPHFHDRIHYALQGGDTERIWIWKANLQMFKDHPILGIGYQENIEALREYYKTVGSPQEFMITHAHNQYLHMLSGTGILGLIVYLAIVIYMLVLATRVWKSISSRDFFHKGLALGVVGAQVAFLVGGLTEANLEHSKMKYALIFVWGITVWLAYEYRILREKL
jgi:O-antigen ligase